MKRVTVVGAGLAGSEIAYQLAKRGIEVKLVEMRPKKYTPAHKTANFAELVCSNSFRSNNPYHAAGILKKELKKIGSLLIKVAEKYSIPAGNALAVDREKFSCEITKILKSYHNIEIINAEYNGIPDDEIVILATGPLTSENLIKELINITEKENFYFYDAIAPIVETESIDFNNAFWGDRYNLENKDYINCPLTKEEYYTFIEALKKAERFPYHDFEKGLHFEGCMPIEEMVDRGDMTLAFGPMKPVGLVDPKTGKQPFAVVQLRKENLEGTAYNMVGFQTKMKIKEQDRVFRLIPALKNAVFLRYGSLHKNIYINAPMVLNDDLSLKNKPNIYIAGQLSGVEGYIESIAQGLIVSLIVYSKIRNKKFIPPPSNTAFGALYYFLRHKAKKFVPSNINFSLFRFSQKINTIKNKKKKKEIMANIAEKNFDNWFQVLKENLEW